MRELTNEEIRMIAGGWVVPSIPEPRVPVPTIPVVPDDIPYPGLRSSKPLN